MLARHQAIGGWPGKTAVAKQLWELAENNTPKQRTGAYTQAIMDLGATLCTRSKPACPTCPLNHDCKAFKKAEMHLYPGKKAAKKLPVRQIFLLVISDQQGKVFLQQRPPSGIWGGLWSFPECESEAALALRGHNLGMPFDEYSLGDTRRHTFSHFHLDYTLVHIPIDHRVGRIAENACRWVKPDDYGEIGLPAPIVSVLQGFGERA